MPHCFTAPQPLHAGSSQKEQHIFRGHQDSHTEGLGGGACARRYTSSATTSRCCSPSTAASARTARMARIQDLRRVYSYRGRLEVQMYTPTPDAEPSLLRVCRLTYNSPSRNHARLGETASLDSWSSAAGGWRRTTSRSRTRRGQLGRRGVERWRRPKRLTSVTRPRSSGSWTMPSFR